MSPNKKINSKLQKRSKKIKTPKAFVLPKNIKINIDLERKLANLKLQIKKFCMMSIKHKKIWSKEIEILQEEIRSLQEEKLYLASIGCRLDR